jgi:hypothetical protein
VLFATAPCRYNALMLTALVHANSSPGALALTLSSLVPAVAEGLISHAVVMLPAADTAAERIADAMGATVIIAASGHWQAAAVTARSEWVLLLTAGEVPCHGWIGAIERHLLQQSAQQQRPALLPLSGLLTGISERLAVLAGAGYLRAGLISSRRRAAEGASGGTPARLSVARTRVAD